MDCSFLFAVFQMTLSVEKNQTVGYLQEIIDVGVQLRNCSK